MASFLADVKQCPLLDLLAMGPGKILYKEHLGSPDMPIADLRSMKELKHVNLQGLCPENGLLLPPDCQLNPCVLCHMIDCKWNTYAMWAKKHTAVVSLAQHVVKNWPRYLQGFAQVQCLTLQIIHFSRVGKPKPDLAALQRIPHVRLSLYDYQHLLLTAGSWQSLEIVIPLGFNIAFSDCRQFVSGTQELLFMGVATTPVDTIVAIMKACQEYGTDCCELRCQDVRRWEIMDPEYVTLSTIVCKQAGSTGIQMQGI